MSCMLQRAGDVAIAEQLCKIYFHSLGDAYFSIRLLLQLFDDLSLLPYDSSTISVLDQHLEQQSPAQQVTFQPCERVNKDKQRTNTIQMMNKSQWMNKYDTTNACSPTLVINRFALHNLQNLPQSVGAVVRLAIDGNNLNFKILFPLTRCQNVTQVHNLFCQSWIFLSMHVHPKNDDHLIHRN